MLYQTELPERAHARDRTKDFQILNVTLSQLSYMGIGSVGNSVAKRGKWGEKNKKHRVLLAGIEPATPGS